MSEIDYDRAVAIWIGQQTGDNPDHIYDITFNTIQEGNCETCEYTTMGITYMLTVPTEKHRYIGEITMTYDSPAQFVREVSAIIQDGEIYENSTADQD